MGNSKSIPGPLAMPMGMFQAFLDKYINTISEEELRKGVQDMADRMHSWLG